MKRYLLTIICLFILFFSIKVEAISGVSLSINSTPEETVAGQYVTLTLSVSGKQNSTAKVIIHFNYNNDYLQLVGFEKGSDLSCTYISEEITCNNEGTGLVYPVFKIKSDFTSDQTIDVVVSESIQSTSQSSKVVIPKKEKEVVVSNIEIDNYNPTLLIGETNQLSVRVYPDNAQDKKVTYTSSNNDIITVSDTGLVSATGEGEASVIAKCGTIEKSVTYTVLKNPIELKEIKVKEKDIILKVGAKKKLVYTLEPADATIKEEDIKITSSNENVIVIDKDLNIIAVGAGDAKITINIGTINTEINVKVEDIKENTKKSSAVVPCIFTAIITFILTLVGVFVFMFKKNKSGKSTSSSINSNGDFKFDM